MKNLFGGVIPEVEKPKPVDIRKSTADVYYIGNNGEWAYFTVDSSLGLLAVYSSFDTLAYTWPNQAGEGFKKFLGGPRDYDYTLNKLCGDWNTRKSLKFGRQLLMPFLEALEAEVKADANTSGQA